MSTPVTGSTSATPAPTPGASTSTKTGSTDKAPADKASFTARLATEMKRIASHASKIDTLKNGAKLYHLANGRLVEQVEGKTPYVVKAGTVPPKQAAPQKPAPTATAATSSDSTTANAQLQSDLAAARAAAAQSGLKE